MFLSFAYEFRFAFVCVHVSSIYYQNVVECAHRIRQWPPPVYIDTIIQHTCCVRVVALFYVTYKMIKCIFFIGIAIRARSVYLFVSSFVYWIT